MKKQGFAFLLAFCWMISMSAVFSFPPKLDLKKDPTSNQTVLNEIQGPQLHLRTSGDHPKTPPFEVDWRLSAKLNSNWIPEFRHLSSEYLAPSFFKKSRALFDVKQTFIRYYYSW